MSVYVTVSVFETMYESVIVSVTESPVIVAVSMCATMFLSVSQAESVSVSVHVCVLCRASVRIRACQCQCAWCDHGCDFVPDSQCK